MATSSARAKETAGTPGFDSARPAAGVVLRAGPSCVLTIRRWIRSGVPVLYGDQEAGIWPFMSLERAGAHPLILNGHHLPQETMCALADRAFALLLEGSPEVAWSRQLFGSPDIDHAFRRWLFEELTWLFQLLQALEQFGLDPAGDIRVLGATSGVAACLNCVRQDQIGEAIWSQIPGSYRCLLRRIAVEDRLRGLRGTGKMLRQVIGAVLFLVRRSRWSRQRRQTSRLAIRTYRTDLGIEAKSPSRLRNVDFIIDFEHFRSEDIVFWVEEGTPAVRLREFLRRGYRIARPWTLDFDPSFLRCRAIRALGQYLWMRLHLNPRSEIAGAFVRTLWHTWLGAQAFAAYFRPRVFLHYNDLSSVSVARNLALRAEGCVPVIFMHSCNHAIDQSGEWRISPGVAFLVCDYFVSWGKEHSIHLARHTGNPGQVWELGCLWSEHARNARENPEIRKYYVDWIESHAQVKLLHFKRIIGVFDTSLSSMLSENDMYHFLAGALQLAGDIPDVLFLYKPKYPFAEVESGEPLPLIEVFGSKGKKLAQNIAVTPNFVVLPRQFETAGVVGLADLVISACFTSTTVEAIGCNTRGIYYDPTDKLSHAFWRRIPGMVCVTDEELCDRVRYLLWECDDETYTDYLRRHCNGIEGHFDGQAITRLRRRLLDVIKSRH